MKLISCHIEAYGKIKGKDYSFSDGITSFCQENGEGKTTLASFIKAMFYGLPSYDNRTVQFCERKHFYPFEGGRFGGNLVFEKEGKRYKIERFFGEKREKDDSLVVYENEVSFDGFGEDIGKSVFGVDKASFEHTAFLDGGEVDISSTSGIRARLNVFLDGGEESDLDGALSTLDSAAKRYKKSRTGIDKITTATDRLDKLEGEIANLQRKKNALNDKYRDSAELKNQIDELRGKISAGQETNERLAKFENYDGLINRVNQAKESIEAIKSKYPLGLPSKEETQSYQQNLRDYDMADKTLKGLELSGEEKGSLEKLEKCFQKGVPTEDKLSSVEKKIDELSSLQTENEVLSRNQDGTRERALKRSFANGYPSESEIQAKQREIEKYKSLKEEYESFVEFVQGENHKPPLSIKRYLIFAIISALVALIGIVLLTVQQVIAGIILLALGVVALLLTGIIYYVNKKFVGAVTVQENPERKRVASQLQNAEDLIKAFLMPYGYFSGNGIVYDFASFQKDVEEYEILQRDSQKNAETIKKNYQWINDLENELNAYFQSYELAGDKWSRLLSDLRVNVRRYEELLDKQANLQLKRKEVEGSLLALKENAQRYCQTYAVENRSAQEVLQDIADLERNEKNYEKEYTNASDYKAANNLEERPSGERVDINGLNGELQEKLSEKNKKDREIFDDEQDVDGLERLFVEQREISERISQYKRKHKLLSAAKELLQTAEGRLIDRYVSPIKNEFLYYAKIIEQALGEKVVMNKDFELRFERSGEERSEKHLSAGQRTICALCFRIALIKNMYQNEMPFIVLDDPFASLDEKHMEKVIEVLKELSKNVQMIYFTCHKSRKI